MSTFNESLHPRGQAGKFTEKKNDPQPTALSAPARTAADYYVDTFYASLSELFRAEDHVQDAQLLAYAAEIKQIAPEVTQVIARWDDESNHLSVDEWQDANGEEVELDEWPDMMLDTFDDYDDCRSRFLHAKAGDTFSTSFVVPLPEVPDLTDEELAKSTAQIVEETDRRTVPADLLRRAKDALNSRSASQDAGGLYALLREFVGAAK